METQTDQADAPRTNQEAARRLPNSSKFDRQQDRSSVFAEVNIQHRERVSILFLQESRENVKRAVNKRCTTGRIAWILGLTGYNRAVIGRVLPPNRDGVKCDSPAGDSEARPDAQDSPRHAWPSHGPGPSKRFQGLRSAAGRWIWLAWTKWCQGRWRTWKDSRDRKAATSPGSVPRSIPPIVCLPGSEHVTVRPE